MRIALLARNDHILAPIRDALAARGIELSAFATIAQLAATIQEQEFGAVLLEDHADHLEACLTLLQSRADAQTAIVIVGDGGAAAMTHALLRGADDYIFAGGDVQHAIQQIMARIGVKLQRRRREILRIGNLELDAVAGEIESSGVRVRLTARETLLARLLFENPGRVVALDRMCIALCGTSDAAAVRSVNQHVYQLRRKLKGLPGDGERLRIEALYRSGYRLAR